MYIKTTPLSILTMPVYLNIIPPALDISFQYRTLYFYYECKNGIIDESHRSRCRCYSCNIIRDYYTNVININDAHRLLSAYGYLDINQHIQRIARIIFIR